MIANILLDLLVVAVIGLGIYSGWKAGFIRIVLKTFASLFAAVFAALFFGKLATVLKNRYFFNFVYDKLSGTSLGVTADELVASVPDSFSGVARIVGLDIEGMAKAAVEGGTDVVESFKASASNALSQLLSSIVAFLVIFAATLFVLKVLSIPLSAIIMKIPVIGTANRTLGLLAGAFATLTLVWVGVWVVGVLDEAMTLGFVEVSDCTVAGLFYRFRLFS